MGGGGGMFLRSDIFLILLFSFEIIYMLFFGVFFLSQFPKKQTNHKANNYSFHNRRFEIKI
ncbi:MAG: hypothetical protein B7Y83_03440 [Flavobacteriales bacterium 32-34-25]|nr:MAG: hypothetical protein B7Y83_03440 [Flavobacteriales bacterium 32-34-25]